MLRRYFSTNVKQHIWGADIGSIYWVLHYKYLLDKGISKEEVQRLNDKEFSHSGGSMAWTQHQVETIKKHGFHFWLYNTPGPLGYNYFLDKTFRV